MTDERLAEIKALCDAATPGEWHVSGDIEHIVFANDGTKTKSNSMVALCDRLEPVLDKVAIRKIKANAAFIAQSRTIVPELIAEVERLQSENESKENYTIELFNRAKSAEDTIDQLQSENAQLRAEQDVAILCCCGNREWRGVKTKESIDNE